MIKFNTNVELEVIENFDEKNDRILDSSMEVFRAGQVVDADLLNEDFHKGDEYVDIQFSNGNLALGVDKTLFEVI